MKNKKLILGTVQFGLDYGINNSIGKPNQIEVNRILEHAFLNNIELLDTAEAYGNAHEVIGNYHKASRGKFKIITKFSSSRNDLPKDLEQRVIENLKTLQVDRLYCYMFHNFNDFATFWSENKDQFVRLKKLDLVDKLGVSVYTNEEVTELLNYDGIDVVQVPFNLLDNVNERKDVLTKAKAKGLEVHTRSAFLQGLFFKELSLLNGKVQLLKNDLKNIQDIVSDNQIKMLDLALHYACKQEFIDHVLIGVDSIQQLKENFTALNSKISDQVLRKIDNLEVENKTLLNPSNWN